MPHRRCQAQGAILHLPLILVLGEGKKSYAAQSPQIGAPVTRREENVCNKPQLHKFSTPRGSSDLTCGVISRLKPQHSSSGGYHNNNISRLFCPTHPISASKNCHTRNCQGRSTSCKLPKSVLAVNQTQNHIIKRGIISLAHFSFTKPLLFYSSKHLYSACCSNNHRTQSITITTVNHHHYLPARHSTTRA